MNDIPRNQRSKRDKTYCKHRTASPPPAHLSGVYLLRLSLNLIVSYLCCEINSSSVHFLRGAREIDDRHFGPYNKYRFLFCAQQETFSHVRVNRLDITCGNKAQQIVT